MGMLLKWSLPVACALLLGCVRLPSLPNPLPRSRALSLSEVMDDGDDRRRASMHMVLDGIEADSLYDFERALSSYQLALRVDPGNPYAYLALARHEIERGEPSRALESVEQCRALLETRGKLSPRVEVQILGLRGAGFAALGRNDQARPLLAEARQRAPSVWEDGVLSADELR